MATQGHPCGKLAALARHSTQRSVIGRALFENPSTARLVISRFFQNFHRS
jgi:hypothetical protein